MARMGRPPMTSAELRFRELFSKQFREELESRQMTQKELADCLGVSHVAVCQWCKGTRVPSLYQWWRIQKVLKEA